MWFHRDIVIAVGYESGSYEPIDLAVTEAAATGAVEGISSAVQTSEAFIRKLTAGIRLGGREPHAREWARIFDLAKRDPVALRVYLSRRFGPDAPNDFARSVTIMQDRLLALIRARGAARVDEVPDITNALTLWREGQALNEQQSRLLARFIDALMGNPSEWPDGSNDPKTREDRSTP